MRRLLLVLGRLVLLFSFIVCFVVSVLILLSKGQSPHELWLRLYFINCILGRSVFVRILLAFMVLVGIQLVGLFDHGRVQLNEQSVILGHIAW